MNFGKTIKKIRKSKNIKIKDICSTFINQGNYWRIENDETIPSTETFLYILEGLNIDFDEFMFFSNIKLNKYNYFFAKLKQAFNQKDINKLINLKEELNKSDEVNQNIKIFHLSLIIDLSISRLTKASYNQRTVNTLKNYLYNCSNWTYYEVKLLNNCLFIFDLDTCLIFFEKAFNRFIYFSAIQKTGNEEIILSQNIITLCLINNRKTDAYRIYEQINKHKHLIKNVYSKVIMLWLEGMIDFLCFNKMIGKEKVDQALNIFKNLEMDNDYKLHKSWTNTLYDHYKIKSPSAKK
ncbi:hypothetical protein ACS127_17145 [Amphibacillus sp. Q70]|uniref:helix-turn-helix domain-containing protein n=1 Tax=Amphibacillus sp. Q70 TaxID=3453416 RepID=UPI003F860FC3